MYLIAALRKARVAESAAFGQLPDPVLDIGFSGMFGSERAPVPAFQVAILLLFRTGDGIEKQFEVGKAADVFKCRAALSGDAAKILDSGIGISERLDRDLVSRPITEHPSA